MNPATLKMYQHTIDQYDSMGYDDGVLCSPEGLETFWLDMMEDFSEEYDADWYPLVATDAIRRTINWNFIAHKYNERRSILDKFSDDEE
jgi:hypothetical protein